MTESTLFTLGSTLCQEPGYDAAPPFVNCAIGSTVPFGNSRSGVFLWAVSTGTSVWGERSGRSENRLRKTTEPCLIVQEVGNRRQVPAVVPVREVIVWHDRMRRAPQRWLPDEFRSSACVTPTEVDGTSTSNLPLLAIHGPALTYRLW